MECLLLALPCTMSQRRDGREILVIVKSLVAISVSFIRKVRLLIIFPFPNIDVEFRKTKQQAQSFLILPSGDEMEKKVWESLGRRWSFANSRDLAEHSWRLRVFPS